MLASERVRAFESDEHVRVSDAASCLAIDVLERRVASTQEPTPRLREALEVLKNIYADSNGGIGYGELVKHADLVTFPNRSVDWRDFDDARIHRGFIRNRNLDALAGMGELIRNPQHFGEEALRQFHIWHDLSLTKASPRVELDGDGTLRTPHPRQSGVDSLWVGLALNAYADHFLEDFFAPGHMTEEAAGRNNMDLNRVHDRDNVIGRVFEIEDWEILQEILPRGEAERSYTLENCFGRVDPENNSVREDSYRRLQLAVSLPEYESFKFFGDGKLFAPPSKDKVDDEVRSDANFDEAGAQALFVALTVARSILDVVESYVSEPGEVWNSFPNQRCVDDSRFGRSDDCYFVSYKDGEDHAGIRFGHYRFDKPGFFARQGIIPVVAGSVELQRLNSGSRQQFSGEVMFNFPADWSAAIIPDAFENMTKSSEVFGRENVALDWSPGYSYIRADDYYGHGPDAHFYVRLKKIYTFVAADIGYRFYEGRGRSTNNVKAGGRLGLEVGPLSVFFAMSRDRSIELAGPRSDGTTWGFGLTLMGSPYSLLARAF